MLFCHILKQNRPCFCFGSRFDYCETVRAKVQRATIKKPRFDKLNERQIKAQRAAKKKLNERQKQAQQTVKQQTTIK